MSHPYFTGSCDVMDLALHRLTGLPLGLFSGKVVDEDEDCGFFYEDCHAVVICDLSRMEWIDAAGPSSGVLGNLHFNQAVFETVLRQVSEDEIRCAFTVEPINEESINTAMRYAIDHLFRGVEPCHPNKGCLPLELWTPDRSTSDQTNPLARLDGSTARSPQRVIHL